MLKFLLKDYSKSICFLSSCFYPYSVNKRFIIIGIILGVIVTAAFFVGSPMFLGFDGSK